MRSGYALLLVPLFFAWELAHLAGCEPFLTRPAATAVESSPIDVADDPIQTPNSSDPIEITRDGKVFKLDPVARYSISGRVVSRKRYYHGWDYGIGAELSPIDLAIAWGSLADTSMDRYISYDHGSRFYHFRYRADTPVSQEYIISHSSNNHIIPATPLLDRALKTVEKGERVTLDGFLVNITIPSEPGYRWDTSLTRTDTGGGACEVIYVTRARIGNSVYGAISP